MSLHPRDEGRVWGVTWVRPPLEGWRPACTRVWRLPEVRYLCAALNRKSKPNYVYIVLVTTHKWSMGDATAYIRCALEPDNEDDVYIYPSLGVGLAQLKQEHGYIEFELPLDIRVGPDCA